MGNHPPPFPDVIRVAVHDDWTDFPDALRFLTPAGSGTWDGVTFAPAADLPDADFVLVLNRPAADGIAVACPPERLWFASGEPPTLFHRPLHLGQGEGTVVVTCDVALCRQPPAELGRTYHFDMAMLRTWSVRRTLDELRRMPPPEKTAGLSWITSDLRTLRGHRRRMDFLEALRRQDIPFDLYGRGFRPIPDKWDGLAPYRYSIAFENSDAPAYFSEKVMDCFVTLTMPIFFGTPHLGRFFPEGSFVRLDPDDPDVFERLRAVVASDRWRTGRPALLAARRLVLERYNLFQRLAGLFRRHMAPPSPPRTVLLRRPDLARIFRLASPPS